MAKETGDAYKFGVEDLADKLGIEPASARIKLRNAGVAKSPTGRYGWKTKEDLGKVADELKATKAAPKAKTDSKSAGKADAKKADVKPAGKGAAAKDAKTGKGDKVGSKTAKDAGKSNGKDAGKASKK